MNIYVDLLGKIAVTSATDGTPAVRPDIRTPITYPVNLYFLRKDGFGGYTYVRFPIAAITLNVRCKAAVEAGRFTLTFRGAETAEIDTRFSADQVTRLLTALPSIGAGNVSVTKESKSLTVEFIGSLAGQVMPAIVARVVSSTPTAATTSLEIAPITSGNANSIQKITLRRPPLATVVTWTEIGVAGGTPGWSGTLDMSAVPLSTWDNPVGDMVIEVGIAAQYARSGSDGVTLSDAVGRSASDGQVITSPGITGSGHLSDNGADSFIIGSDVNGVYGRKFTQGDLGRIATDTDGYLFPGTVIVEVIDDGITNAARLSQRYTAFGMGLGASINYTLAGLPSDVFYSPTANWTATDVGHVVTASTIPVGTRIMAIIDTRYVRLSQKATAVSAGLTWNIASDTRNIFQSATALFAMSDVGAKIRAPTMFDGDAIITKWISTTQVEVNVRPKVAGTAVAWKFIPARGYPPPTIVRLAPGSAIATEIQKIALAQVAVGGQLTFQDGYGSGMPLVTLDNPVSASGLQNALNQAYPNYGYCQVSEVVPGAEWNVTFGKNGSQRLLTVNESQALYERAILDWIIADAVESKPGLESGSNVVWNSGSPSVTTRGGMLYINVLDQDMDVAVGPARYERLTDGTKAVVVRQRRMCFADRHTPKTLGNVFFSGYPYYIVGEEGGQERNGIYTYDLVGATVPANRNEVHQQMRSVIQVSRSTNAVGQLVDIQLVTVSISTTMVVRFTYWLQGNEPGTPNDSKTATIVHFIDGSHAIVPYNGFDTTNGNYGTTDYISWSRRRWMGHIWEQRTNVG